MKSRQDIEFIFLDIDGTMVFDGELLPSAIETVQLLLQQNRKVALCTGRSVLHAQIIQDMLGLTEGVFFNGALVKRGNDVVRGLPFEQHVVERMIEYTQRHRLPLILHTDSRAIAPASLPERYAPLLKHYQYPEIEIVDIEDWLTTGIDVFQSNVFMTRTWDLLTENHFEECLLYRWDEEAVDLQVRGTDKSVGALALLETYGIEPEYALHIGDGGNDIGMFQAVGTAIAMGNAPESVQAHATMVTKPVDKDGMYHAFLDLGLI